MAKDADFAELHSSLKKNAKDQQKHDPAEQKAREAQGSSVSPGNERMSKAKAVKVEKLGGLSKPKEFNAAELKNNILKEVDKLLKEKEQQANDTGDKPKIKEQEITEVKEKNAKDIKDQKTESIGEVEATHKEAPDESKIENRANVDVIVEDPGAGKTIRSTEKAVAKPISDERITLEKESGKIDSEMAKNEVDETQLEESNEDKFTGPLDQKRESQKKASEVKEVYRQAEETKLEKDKEKARETVNSNVEQIHETRQNEFGNVNAVKNATKSADELKRKEVSDAIEKIYTDSEKSVNEKLAALETSVSTDFDAIMATANGHFKTNVNDGLDDEFTSEFISKHLDRDDYNRRVRNVFVRESDKYKTELSDALTPLTTKIANTLNGIVKEIQAAKEAVTVYVNRLSPDLAEVGLQSAKGVLEKFSSLEESVNQKQEALTNNLAKKYADGVTGLEAEFKKIMDERKSWLEKALDAIVDAIKEIINLFIDLKKALERAAEYGKRIIKAPLKFLDNLVKGATAGFNNFVKNIGKHLLQGALEWVTGEMGDAGIQLPEQFDFKGILSIILQILGISVNNVKEIAKKVIGEKYVNMLEKGVDMGVKAGDKILQIFSIVKKDGIAGLWEFIKEQFTDLKEKMMEEAKSFIITTIVEVAVVKVVSMLIPGAGFISAVKSLIDFLRTLFAKARQIVNIITGIIDTFGEILAGNVAKVSGMVENVLAKFLSMAITFLAAILGLGKVGKKINDIIQKKIKDPINKAITKMMEKLKVLMTKLGIFKFLDKVDDKIKQGSKWVDEKKEKAKSKAMEGWDKAKGFFKNLFTSYTDKSGEKHTLNIEEKGNKFVLIRHSIATSLQKYLDELDTKNNSVNKDDVNFKTYKGLISTAKTENNSLGVILSKNFNQKNGETVKLKLANISEILKKLPSNISKNKSAVPEVKDINWTTKVNSYSLIDKNSNNLTNLSSIDGESVDAPIISLNSKKYVGSEPASSGSSKFWNDMNKTPLAFKKRVRGHILNHQLFGTGADVKNLGPIPIAGNNEMKNVFETGAKNTVHTGDIVSFKVKYIYHKPNDSKGEITKKFPGLTLPIKVLYDVNKLVIKGNVDTSNQDLIDNPNSWKKDPTGFKAKGSIPINHDDFF